MEDKILIVDDCQDVSTLLRFYVENAGLTTCIASSGEEAITRISQESFALVLLDLSLPGIDGLDAIQAIRNFHSPIELPILVVSADKNSSTVVRALRIGANDYVTKPVDMATLLARMDAHLSRRRIYLQLLEAQKEMEQVIAAKDIEKRHKESLLNAALDIALREISRKIESIGVALSEAQEHRYYEARTLSLSSAAKLCKTVRRDSARLKWKDISIAAANLEAYAAQILEHDNAESSLSDESRSRLSALYDGLWSSVVPAENQKDIIDSIVAENEPFAKRIASR